MTTDRDELIAEMFPEPIATYVDALASSEDHPVVAVTACLTRYHEAGPLLREILTRAADGKIATTREDNQLFRALHIVGGARDALAFRPLLRFLQGPSEEVEWFLGDAGTETLPKIVAGVFDGNDEALFDAIANRRVPGTVRGALLRSAAFLTHEKRIDPQKMIAFLERFASQEPTPGDELAWFDWTESIALLGLRHLEPLVSAAETAGRLDELIFERDEFEKLLARTEQVPDDGTRFKENGLGYLDDVPGELERFHNDEDENDDEFDGEQDLDDWAPSQPVINPWRHVGRNDPCPCGSGKKAKRCCLAA